MFDIPVPEGPIDFNYSIGKLEYLDYYGEKRLFIVSVTAAEAAQAKKEITQVIRNYLMQSQSIEHDNQAQAHKWGYRFDDGAFEAARPDPRRTTERVKEGMSHKDFKKRKLAGEIMVSNYERAEVEVISYPGFVSDSVSDTSSYLSLKSLLEANVLGVRSYFNGQRSTVSFKDWTIGAYIDSDGNDFMYTRRRTTYGEWTFGASVNASTVLSACRSHKPEVESLVTSVLAKANRSAVDVLTAFAEAPKSIASVLRGFALVASMLRDAKKGQFNVTQAYAKRDKKRSEQYQKRMKRLDRELSNSSLSSSRRSKLQAHKNREYVGHRKYLADSAVELTDALANVWLNYRYNIMPNVYLAQDVYDATDKFARQWITARGTERTSFSIPLFAGMRVDVDGKVKITIKRGFSKPFANSGQTVISADLFVTAWELVPLSFVYDWFINVGDMLSAQTYKTTWDQEGNTLAYEYKFDAELTPPTSKTYVIEPRVVIRGFYYRRDVINPIDYCGLVWKPKLGLERQIDALALIWRPVRSLLQKGRNR